MYNTCPHCSAACESTARFCPSCGTALGATMPQRPTVVMPGTRVEETRRLDVDAIVKRARTTFGTERTLVMDAGGCSASAGQRELTDVQVDCSTSMGDPFEPGIQKIEAASRAAINLVLNKYRIDPSDQVGITIFTDSAKVEIAMCPVGANKPRIIQTLQSLRADGGTDLDTPLRLRLADFDWDRTDAVRRIVLLTDGQGGDPERSAEALKERGVVMDVIAIGPTPSEVNETLLRRLASPGRYRFIKDQRTLVQHYTQLAQKTATSVR